MNNQHIYHHLTAEKTLSLLHSSHFGLTWDEVEKRWAQYGPNIISSKRKTSKLKILLDQLINPLVLILFLATLISVLADHAVDALVIGGIIVINTAIGYFQESKAEDTLAALKNRSAPQAVVLRINPAIGENVEQTIRSADIVPGDVILLETGDKVPADCRILSSINLEIDESTLTGESLPVRKIEEPVDEKAGVSDRVNTAYAGTVVTHGRGKAVVYATGTHTEIGKIARLIQETEESPSPLKKQVNALGKNLAFIAIFLSALVFLIGSRSLNGSGLEDLFLFALATAISAIPEGLPAVMTITLAVGVKRMADRNAIIRKLQAVDTLGAATAICSDKTGTLTTNQMTVKQIHAGDQEINVGGIGFDPHGDFTIANNPTTIAKDSPAYMTLLGGVLCNDAHLLYNQEQPGNEWSVRGDPTEAALVVAAHKAQMYKDVLEEQLPRRDEVPFDSKKKYMATFHHHASGEQRIFLKGAPEEVLAFCSNVLTNTGTQKLTSQKREDILAHNEKMAQKAMRVLAVAYCDEPLGDMHSLKENIYLGKQCLVFAGLIGMIDPPRQEAREAIRVCKRAGIKVIMATGDHPITAKAIARDLNLLERGGRVMTGSQLEKLSDVELDNIVENTPVFARVSPEHKYRLVESLKRLGHVVAMTGDGVNDAPALKSAQVGVAMGISGTDVAKEAADMVLTDDDFASIVSAVEEGRVVFQNIRKVVKFLISTNFGEMLAIIFSMLLFKDIPLIFTPVQILWVNLVTDGVLDISIAMEPKENEVMLESPRAIDARIVNNDILFNTLMIAVFMAAGTLAMFARGFQSGGIDRGRTLAFVTLAMYQVFNAFNVRSRSQSVFKLGLFTNKYLNVAIPTSIVLLLATVYLPFMQRIMQTMPLHLNDWVMIIALSGTVLVVEEIRKALRGKKRTSDNEP
ncbi:MAG: HAD-IC family P-type ATPase [Chloroflexi bacterium]|nr:HAD-IC family P-type ATPase [Chloroflexota bacterium]